MTNLRGTGVKENYRMLPHPARNPRSCPRCHHVQQLHELAITNPFLPAWREAACNDVARRCGACGLIAPTCDFLTIEVAS